MDPPTTRAEFENPSRVPDGILLTGLIDGGLRGPGPVPAGADADAVVAADHGLTVGVCVSVNTDARPPRSGLTT